MSKTHRSTYRRAEHDNQPALDAWFRKRQDKQLRQQAEDTERSLRSSAGGYSFA